LNLRVDALNLDPEVLLERQLDGFVYRQPADRLARLLGGRVRSGLKGAGEARLFALTECGHRHGRDCGRDRGNPRATNRLVKRHRRGWWGAMAARRASCQTRSGGAHRRSMAYGTRRTGAASSSTTVTSC